MLLDRRRLPGGRGVSGDDLAALAEAERRATEHHLGPGVAPWWSAGFERGAAWQRAGHAPPDPATPDLIAQAVELALVTDVAVDALADALTYALAGDPDSAARRLTALVEMFHEEDE